MNLPFLPRLFITCLVIQSLFANCHWSQQEKTNGFHTPIADQQISVHERMGHSRVLQYQSTSLLCCFNQLQVHRFPRIGDARQQQQTEMQASKPNKL